MPANLTTFLNHVALSAKAHEAFEKDPASAVKAVGLSTPAKEAVLSKDPGKIRDVILAERGIHAGGVAAGGDTEIVLVIVI